MNFKITLENYINILGGNANELAKYSKISASVISRYRNGERIPKIDSEKITLLINGIVLLAKEKNIPNITQDNVREEFSKVLNNTLTDFKSITYNLNMLINCLNINTAELSRYLGYDPSFLSRIRTGIRKPAYIDSFIQGICNFIKANYSQEKIISIIKSNINDNINEKDYLEKLKFWLINNKVENNYTENFFKNLDDFNLDDYIKTIHFNDLKVPTVPFTFPKTKNYYGLEEMKHGELDFFKGTVLSKNQGDVLICSDMQMDDMAKDLEFSKKWMFGLAMLIKKGHHLNVIHNLDRPINEMMLGLESWIPIYMTGQVSPYYFKKNQNNVYSHLNYISNNYALCGECIINYHKDGKYYLTNNKIELNYYHKKAELLLNKSMPVMDIYTINRKKEFNNFIENDIKTEGNRTRILSSLPLHTISKELLLKILKRNKINDNDIKLIIAYYEKEKSNIKNITRSNKIIDKITEINKYNFESTNVFLDLSKLFYNNEIKYCYSEYNEHLNMAHKYSEQNNNYSLLINDKHCFKNIDICINENNYVIISKRNNPNIQFVIKNDKLIHAIKNFNPPVVER